MKKFHKSQRDPNLSRRVNPGLEKGYPARRVDPGWLLRSCKYLLHIDCTRVDPLRRVEANPGSCKGGLYRIDFRSGSEIDPIQCEQCLRKSNQTGVELFTPYRIDICFGLAKANLPRVQESDNKIPFQKWGRSTEQVVHIRSRAFQKLSDTERITFGIGAFQLVIVTAIVPGRLGQM